MTLLQRHYLTISTWVFSGTEALSLQSGAYLIRDLARKVARYRRMCQRRMHCVYGVKVPEGLRNSIQRNLTNYPSVVGELTAGNQIDGCRYLHMVAIL